MSKEKKKREPEYKKVQNELKLLAGKPNGWKAIEKKLKEKNDILTANDIKSLKRWVDKEKDTRKTALKTELDQINDFFKQYKETPKILRQIGLFKKGLAQNSPMYDSLLDSQRVELVECDLKLEYGFVPKWAAFKWMEDERWQKLMEQIVIRKKSALETQIKDIEKILAEVEEELQAEKSVKDKRVAQIKEELIELGVKFPKDELSYIG